MSNADSPAPGEAISVDQLADMYGKAEEGQEVQAPKQAEEPKGEGEVVEAEEPQEGEGEQEAETEETPPEDAGEPFVKFDANGKEVSYTREEAIDLIKKGYGYGKQSESVKQREAELAQTMESVTQERQRYAQFWAEFAPRLQQEADKFAQIDWDNLLATDPVEYLQKKREHEKFQASEQVAKAEQEKVNKALIQDYAAQQAAKLREAMPDVFTQEGNARLGAYMAKGFTQEELAKLAEVPLHHQILIWAENSRRYEEGQAKAKTAIKEVKKAPPKLAKQGVRPDSSALSDARKRLSKTHGMSDLADYFAQLERR